MGNAAYGVGGSATTGGEVNIANGTNGRRITGLAAGSNATDAVNVSQLDQMGQNAVTALGGGAALNSTTGVWTAPSYSTNSINAIGTNTGPLVSNNVGAALTNLNTSLTNTAAVAVKYDNAATKTQVTFNPAGTAVKLTNIAVGALTATSSDAVNGSQLFTTSQNTAAALGGGAAVNASTGAWTAPSYSTNSISVNGTNTGALVSGNVGAALTNLSTSVTNTAAVAVKYDAVGGNTITLGATGGAGAPAGGVKITNLTAGALNGTSTDAVNGSQLFATNTTVTNLGTQATTLGNTSASTLGGGATYSSATGVTGFSQPINAISSTGVVGAATAQTSVAGALSALNTDTVNTANIAVKYDAVGGNTITLGATGGAGAPAGGVKITNLSAGALNGTSTDAVNGSQLFATNTTVTNLGTQATTLGNTSASTLGGGATYSSATGITGFSQPINAISSTGVVGAGTAQTSVAGALSALNTDTVNTANIAVKYDAVGGNTITLGATGGAGAPAGGVKITNLTAGALNGTSTDAVNGSQLFATNQTVNNINNGAGIKYFHANSILADSTATGQDSVAVGPTASSTAANAVAIGNGAIAGTANSVALGNGATTAAANATASGVVNGATFNYAGAVPTGVLSVGSAGNERQITNVAAGQVTATSTDAINGSQLFATDTAVTNLGTQATTLGNTSASTLGGGATYSSATGVTGFSQPINAISSTGVVGAATAQTSVAGALSALNTDTVNTANIAVKYDAVGGNTITLGATGGAGAPAGGVKITNLSAGALNGTSTDAVNGSQLFATNQTVNNINNGAGIKYFHANSILADSTATGQDSVAVGPAASSTATNAVAIGNGAVAGTANSIALGNGATTATANATASGVVNGATFNYAGATPTGVLSVGGAGNERQITNVAAGQVSATSTDAVNGSQLFSTNTAVDGLGTQVNNLVNNGAGIKYFHANSILADSTATGQDSVAVGPAASSTATNAVAIGNGAVAGTSNSIALGNGATTATANATASGVVNGATFNYAGAAPTGVLSVGSAGNERQITNVSAGRVSASSTDAVNGSQLFSTNTAVDGLGTQVNNLVNNGTGIKYFHANSTLADSTATGQDSVAIGPAASSTAANSVALGSNSLATGSTLTNAAYGIGGAATGGEVNIANGADGRRLTGLAAGSNSTDAVNVSQLNLVGQDAAQALGGGAQLDATTGVWTAPSYVTNSINAAGADTGPLTSSNVGNALSNLSTGLTNIAAVGVKYDDATTRTQVTFNPGGAATKLSNVAAGDLSSTSSDAVNGSQLFATNEAVDNIVNNGTGIKYFHANSTLADSSASGLDSVAIGPLSVATGANSFAAGTGATASADGGLALGHQSQVLVSGGIALGEGSVANRALAPATGSIPVGSGAITYDTADATLLGSVSVGKAGAYRQITNVADGTEANDAVTLRQLTGAMGSLSSTGTLYFHANSTNPVDSLATGAESIAVGPATVVNGDNGIGIGDQATVGQAAAGGIAIGRNTQVLLASGIAVGSAAQASAEQSVALGAGANASQAMSVALGSSSITTVGAETDYSAYRLTAPQTSVGEVGIGTALGNRKLTGVAAGTQDNDAVNVAQLKSVGDQVDQNTTDITNLDGRVGGLENLIGSGGGIKYLHVNSTSADSSATGSNAMALGPQAVASGSSSVAVGNGAKASADGSVALGSGASDDGRGAETYTGQYSGANNVTSGTVSVGDAATGATRTISNVADGKDATDAVNVRQLDGAVAEAKQYTDTSIANLDSTAVQQDGRISAVESDVSNIKNGTDGMFQVNNSSAAAKPQATGVNSLAGGAGAVASGNNSAAVGTQAQASGENSVAVGNGAKASAKNATALGTNSVADRDNSVSVGSVGSERQITNVAAGTSGTDAVNFDQLTKSVAGITDSANAYTDQRYAELKNDLKQQDETLSAGIAGAMAMASLPQSYSPGASMTTAAASTYRGQSSVAFGVSHLSGNGRWLTKLQGSTDTQRNVGVAVGVGYQW
ncbi:YadA-like family protein [Pseudomonas sp. N3-W]|uniref:YadA-like family protein n=1 Tax=Pseudomonas sp. N3-W TaxID=2975049 RepID=UPI002877BF4D|nr:YadA-like family protein [Pseudomonas sp. N3-W]